MTHTDGEFFSQFPQLAELIGGTRIDKTLGFIDLTGTKAAVGKYLKDPTFNNQVALSQLQAAFSSALAKLAKTKPNLEIIVASDGAFLVGSSAEVLDGLVEAFTAIPGWFYNYNLDRFQPLPIRAAMAKGLVQLHVSAAVSALKNFSHMPYWGEAFTKVHLMERQKPKGLRIFVTKSVAAELSSPQSDWIIEKEIGTVAIHGQGSEPYYQMNWLLIPPLGGTKAMAKIVEVGRVWAVSSDRHYRLHGRSIVELSGKDVWLYHLPAWAYKLARSIANLIKKRE